MTIDLFMTSAIFSLHRLGAIVIERPSAGSGSLLGDSLRVEQRTLTPLVLVRIQVPQPNLKSLYFRVVAVIGLRSRRSTTRLLINHCQPHLGHGSECAQALRQLISDFGDRGVDRGWHYAAVDAWYQLAEPAGRLSVFLGLGFGPGSNPSLWACLRCSFRARRIASPISRARFSDGFS